MSSPNELKSAHDDTRAAWNANAAYWDDYMGEKGNDFVNLLIWPASQQLLAVQPGWRVLDAACGNGLYARRLAALGADVVAFDFAAEMIRRAKAYPSGQNSAIDYRVIDATDETALLALGEAQFDAATCQMALFDISEIDPLFRALARLLRPGGRFVFSILHPCFNQPGAIMGAELVDREGRQVTVYSVRVHSYLTPLAIAGEALRNQPSPHIYFHRPLHNMLAAGFAAGFVLDALQEQAFPPDHPPGSNPISWSGRYHEIPPVLVARMRLP